MSNARNRPEGPGGPDARLPEAEKPIRPILKKAYQVLKYMQKPEGGMQLTAEVIEAHLMQHCEPATVQFIDVESDPEWGITTKIHRVIFNVEDITEIPMPQTPKILH